MDHISFKVLLWRFVSGAHLNGRQYTNASWFKPGTLPRHQVNWWTSKPRFHRILWRWLTIFGLAIYFVAYKFAPIIRLNLTIGLTLAWLPFGLDKGWRFIHSLTSHTVKVSDTAQARGDLDTIVITDFDQEKKSKK